jgi:hypothetical protein
MPAFKPTPTSSEPAWRIVLIVGTLALSWLGMQIVHELGHVAAAWFTGGTVVHVELKPWSISRTDVAPNPSPLVVAWSGALVGIALPLCAWWITHTRHAPSVYLWRFFAGFCLIANGVYLGVGALVHIGDPADILRLHVPIWPLLSFGLLTLPAGFALWHGLGTQFGLGPAAQPVSRRHAIACTALLFAIVAVEALTG